MPFNSYEFILLFLPASVFGFFVVSRFYGRRAGLVLLIAASLFFYGLSNPKYLLLLLLSIAFNFSLGRAINGSDGRSTLFLVLGIVVNAAVLGYYKYTNFFLENINAVLGVGLPYRDIVFPLGISFFTFQQIAYLVDKRRGNIRDDTFINYCLFVAFFPKLMMGPLLKHTHIAEHTAPGRTAGVNWEEISAGSTMFVLGLFKKVVIADGIAQFANPVFGSADSGAMITFFEGWGGALAYTLELYFDFSGYSDMALGLGRLFGFHLPINFFSPYKAVSIIDFWRRWHMTLSQFLRDYLYFSLGGNRKGRFHQYANIFVTMLIGGLWHGAGWAFILWGMIHGAFLIVNHVWRLTAGKAALLSGRAGLCSRACSIALTFCGVVVAWVFFRAGTLKGALRVLGGMAGLNGFVLPDAWLAQVPGIGVLRKIGVKFGNAGVLTDPREPLLLLLLLAVVWFAPNVAQIVDGVKPSANDGFGVDAMRANTPAARFPFAWRPTTGWAIVIGLLGCTAMASLVKMNDFLYLRF